MPETCWGRPIPEGLPAKRMLFLSWVAEGVTIKAAVENMAAEENKGAGA